jgi:hypothetical protein
MGAMTRALVACAALLFPLALLGCNKTSGEDDASATGAGEEDETSGEELVGSLTVGTKLKTTSAVNLRQTPSTKAKVLEVVAKGATVEVRKSAPQGGFYYIKSGSREGWSSGKYLTIVETPGGGGQVTATTDCQKSLVARGIQFKPTKARGVVDAVMVTGPVGGVLFASGKTTAPAGDPVACEFVKTMEAMGKVLKEHGFVRVGTLGSYCFRCCCSWSETNTCRDADDPEPSCGDKGFSDHSWGRAVDIRYLFKADGTVYDVNNPNHFIMSGSGDTCGAGRDAQSSTISRQMYDVACAIADKGIVEKILTPNRDANHRNHFHIDIGKEGLASEARSTTVELHVRRAPTAGHSPRSSRFHSTGSESHSDLIFAETSSLDSTSARESGMRL